MVVYVSNAEDGEIGSYVMQPDGSLEAGPSVAAARPVGPLAVDPQKRFLVAAGRAKPCTACSYAIERASGVLRPLGTGPLAESLPYITFDRGGRYLLGASYGGDLVCVNPVSADGRVGAPLQVTPTARNAHAIVTDNTNRFVFVPHLGTDQVFQFRFDGNSGRLSPNTPPHVQLKAGSGPRHLRVSRDNRFVYVLGELDGTITTLALDSQTGILRVMHAVSFLPSGSNLRPGAPRPTAGRDVSNDVWASDLHLTPDGRFLYAAERTRSTLSTMKVDADGRLHLAGYVETERQPRGFAIDPGGRTMIVTGEKSATISSYAIDRSSGALRLIGRYPTGKGSNWVEIVSFD
jgi:6-phosphogluconolactonase